MLGHAHADSNDVRKLFFSMILAFVLSCFEFLAGLYSHSTAIIADSAHMLVDVISFLISILSIYLATIQANKSFTYGYSRIEVFGAFLSILIVWILIILLLFECQKRYKEQRIIKPDVLIFVGIFGIFANWFLFKILHSGGDHSHHHHHHVSSNADQIAKEELNTENCFEDNNLTEKLLNSNSCSFNDPSEMPLCCSPAVQQEKKSNSHKISDSELKNKQIALPDEIQLEINNDSKNSHKKNFIKNNLNIDAAIVHCITDILQNIGVLITGIIIKFYPSLYSADIVCTVIFSLLMFYYTLSSTTILGKIFFQGVTDEKITKNLYTDFMSTPFINKILDFHIWELKPRIYILSATVYVPDIMVSPEVLRNLKELCMHKYNISHSTIEIQNSIRNEITDKSLCYNETADTDTCKLL